MPLVIHRVIFGAVERFFAILVEHYAGAFPTWLSPVQVALLPVSDKHNDAADKLHQEFLDQGIRSEVDHAKESVGYKIREAVKQKVPYVLVIGDKESKGTKFAVRERDSGKTIDIDKKKFVEKVRKESSLEGASVVG
mgnify:CR=1 FL=1